MPELAPATMVHVCPFCGHPPVLCRPGKYDLIPMFWLGCQAYSCKVAPYVCLPTLTETLKAWNERSN